MLVISSKQQQLEALNYGESNYVPQNISLTFGFTNAVGRYFGFTNTTNEAGAGTRSIEL